MTTLWRFDERKVLIALSMVVNESDALELYYSKNYEKYSIALVRKTEAVENSNDFTKWTCSMDAVIFPQTPELR